LRIETITAKEARTIEEFLDWLEDYDDRKGWIPANVVELKFPDLILADIENKAVKNKVGMGAHVSRHTYRRAGRKVLKEIGVLEDG